MPLPTATLACAAPATPLPRAGACAVCGMLAVLTRHLGILRRRACHRHACALPGGEGLLNITAAAGLPTASMALFTAAAPRARAARTLRPAGPPTFCAPAVWRRFSNIPPDA